MRSYRNEVENLREQLVAWRRDFHQHPEIAFEEVRTSQKVAEVLTQLGLEVQYGVGKTGVVGILEGTGTGPTVLVRADMDALPIHEENDVPYKSQTTNRMHACGHDGHTAIALSVAKILAAHREQINGAIKFVFQPAEEIAAGAKAMIDDGVMEGLKPDVSLGLHLWNDMPVGRVAVTEGPAMASSDSFRLWIEGRGGHGASPHQTHDPLLAAAQIITAVQSIISRNVPPLDAGVLSCTMIRAGDAFNVIPSEVEIKGTIRSYKNEIRDLIVARFEAIASGIAHAMNCTARLEFFEQTPPLVNDHVIGERLRYGFGQIDNNLEIVDDVRTMGAEDMGFFLERAPGVYFFVGSANASRGLDYPHHHPRFDVDEEALIIGASLLTAAVADYVIPGQ
ncbi:MAG: amidohydrolase [Chloroflexi bacterium]|nr:amidohydrolase [Chloroflexota bacterium]